MSKVKLILATIIVAGYFATLWLYGMGEIDIDENNQPILILIGGLASAFGAIVAWYFGSSEGSSRKTDLLTKDKP